MVVEGADRRGQMGQFLVKSGALTSEQLGQALDYQDQTGNSLLPDYAGTALNCYFFNLIAIKRRNGHLQK